MQHIYSRASSVLVWLGRATEQTVPAFRLLLGLAELSHSSPEDQKDYIAHVIRDECFKGHWLAIGELLQREWWYRVWSIQEVVLGSKIRIICGPFAVERELIKGAITVFQLCYNYTDGLMQATTFSKTCHYFFPFQNGAYKMYAIARLKAYIRQKKDTWSSQRLSFGGNLADLLDKTTDYNATDPRDKVYALVELLEQVRYKSPLRVNYRVSVEDLYIQVAKIIRQDSGTLDIMSQVEVER